MLTELMARLGHTTPGAALRYQHAAKDRDRVIADALSTRRSRPVSGQSRGGARRLDGRGPETVSRDPPGQWRNLDLFLGALARPGP
jgi:hypothetical protein